MNKRFNRNQRNYIIAGLCMILIIMGVGYAAFQSQLKISGTSNIASNFIVKITDIQSSVLSGTPTDAVAPSYTDTTATFHTNLVSPGDSMKYEIRIENQGNIDAVLKTITKTDTSNSAILFETSGVNEGDELKAGEAVTMIVTVTYNPAVTSQPGDLESNLTVELDYEQTGGSEVGPGPGGNTTTIGGQEVEIVESGDGLYKDEYEDGKYTYKGANPNNYITFNNETWRIISIDSNGLIKIMKNESIGNRDFDSGNINDWETSDIKTYLNDTYLPTITVNQDKIVPHTWSRGGVTDSNGDLAGQIADENGTQSQSVSVGLITVSEYLRANTNTEQCETFILNNDNRTTCSTTNWMYSIVPSGGNLWTISPSASSNSVFVVSGYAGNAGNVSLSSAYASRGVSPVLYLKSDITLIGDGSQGNPYVIS